jgi:hypothetical protein
VRAIAAGFDSSLALRSDGTVIGWGCEVIQNYGQCSVPPGLSGVTAIAAGDFHSLALRSDGTVVAWGCGSEDGYSPNRGQCSVPAGLSGVVAISASTWHSLALKSDGTVVAWGCGIDFGQCAVPSGLSDVVAIAAGFAHSVALRRDGTVVGWGCGPADYGQCRTPDAVSGVRSIATGGVHTLAILKASQTIDFAPLPPRTFGDPNFAVSASASSGLPVAFSATGACSVSGATVHLSGAGSCTITASQPGDPTYAAAPDVSQTFSVAKAAQTITFPPLRRKRLGAPDVGLRARASSGLPVSYTGRGSCRVRGRVVHLTRPGRCAITAAQRGDANYLAARSVTRTFTVAPRRRKP